jgi:hypothetical protein
MKQPRKVTVKERIFQIEDFDGNIFLCNLKDIELKDLQQIKKLKHYWNHKFEAFGKIDLKEMIISHTI